MKKFILLAVLVLTGCNPFDDGRPDHYKDKKSLLPTEVVALHKVCRSQPNYDTSWIINRGDGAKGVMCRYRDSDAVVKRTYTIDAEVLRIKIQEGLK